MNRRKSRIVLLQVVTWFFVEGVYAFRAELKCVISNRKWILASISKKYPVLMSIAGFFSFIL